ncbi:MAG: hypothetical protein E5X44_25005 [Mesorhizobium sp.]|nr:MAG: hypothetical protein E5X44_25005 [Mesorhizobium sp.]
MTTRNSNNSNTGWQFIGDVSDDDTTIDIGDGDAKSDASADAKSDASADAKSDADAKSAADSKSDADATGVGVGVGVGVGAGIGIGDATANSTSNNTNNNNNSNTSSNTNNNNSNNNNSNTNTNNVNTNVNASVSAHASSDGKSDDDFADLDDVNVGLGGVMMFSRDGDISFDPGDDISFSDVLNGAFAGAGNGHSATIINQTGDMKDNDYLGSATVKNDGYFGNKGDAKGGYAKSDEGIDAGGDGGHAGDSVAFGGFGAKGGDADTGSAARRRQRLWRRRRADRG